MISRSISSISSEVSSGKKEGISSTEIRPSFSIGNKIFFVVSFATSLAISFK